MWLEKCYSKLKHILNCNIFLRSIIVPNKTMRALVVFICKKQPSNTQKFLNFMPRISFPGRTLTGIAITGCPAPLWPKMAAEGVFAQCCTLKSKEFYLHSISLMPCSTPLAGPSLQPKLGGVAWLQKAFALLINWLKSSSEALRVFAPMAVCLCSVNRQHYLCCAVCSVNGQQNKNN